MAPPTNPRWPATKIREDLSTATTTQVQRKAGFPKGLFLPREFDVVIHHERDQLLEPNARRPSQSGVSFGRISEKDIDLCGTQIARVYFHDFGPVQVDTCGCLIQELANRMSFPGGHHVIVRHILLEHEPHGFHVVARIAPIAVRVEIAEVQLALQPKFDAAQRARNLTSDEGLAAPLRLMVKQDAITDEQVVRFAKIDAVPDRKSVV